MLAALAWHTLHPCEYLVTYDSSDAFRVIVPPLLSSAMSLGIVSTLIFIPGFHSSFLFMSLSMLIKVIMCLANLISSYKSTALQIKKTELDSVPTAFLTFLNTEVRSTIARDQSIFKELTSDSSFLLISRANLSVAWASHKKVKPTHSLQDTSDMSFADTESTKNLSHIV